MPPPPEESSPSRLDEALQRAEERLRDGSGKSFPGTSPPRPASPSTMSAFEQVFAEQPESPRSGATTRSAIWISGLALCCFVILVGFFAYRRWEKRHAVETSFSVELQANAPGVQFTVDGRPVVAASVNLSRGPHQIEAAAPGFETETKTITVPESGAAPIVFALRSLLPGLRVTTPFQNGRYILDGDNPIDLNGGLLTEEHLISGKHSLRIMARDQEMFVIDFTTRAAQGPEVINFAGNETISALMISSAKDSGKLYATQDWQASSLDGAVRPITKQGIDLKFGSGIEALSEDGKVEKLETPATNGPILTVVLRRLPPKVPVVISANVPDPVIMVDGRRLEDGFVTGRAFLKLYAGTYKVKLMHRDYEDSPVQVLSLNGSSEQATPLQFVLKPAGAKVLLTFGAEAGEATVLVDGVTAQPSRVGGGRYTLLANAGHHLITVKKRNFEDFTIARDFEAGETANLSLVGMKPLRAE